MRSLLLLCCLLLAVIAQRSTTPKPKVDHRGDPCSVCKTIAEHARKIHMDEDDETAVRRTMEVAKYVTDFNQYIWKIIVQQYWDPIFHKVNAGQTPEAVCSFINICHPKPV